MAYIKYKEVTKYFNFSKTLPKAEVPKYVLDYLCDDEDILVHYKTSRDHGIFTNKKIILFDNYSFMGLRKQVFIIPYKSISTISVIFFPTKAELSLFLDSGYPLRLKFVNMSATDKTRLRVLFTCISCYVNNQEPNEEDVDRLLEDDFE